MPASNATAEIHGAVRRLLGASGIRYTTGRRALVATIQKGSGPRSAAELADEAAGTIPVSSLYRTLVVFEEAGIVSRHHGPDGVARYELTERLAGHHHHLVCVVCGTIQDVDVSDKAERRIHSIASGLGVETGFRVIDHVLEVEGVCGDCEQH